jgi:hypothetical protein
MPAYKFVGNNFELWESGDPGFDPNNLFRNRRARYFLPSIHEWHKAAYYDPIAGVYYDYPTGSDSVPDGIDFVGDPEFDAVFYDGGLNADPNVITNAGLLSPYDTAGQGGNVDEWLETAADRINNTTPEQRIRAGGAWGDGPNLLAAWNPSSAIPTRERLYSGFRIATVVPEPNSIFVAVGSIAALFVLASRKR